jgi:hypothetical protein
VLFSEESVVMVITRMSCLSLARQYHGLVVHAYSHLGIVFLEGGGLPR